MAKTTMTNKYDFKQDVQEFYSKREKKLKAKNGNEYIFKFDNHIKETKKQQLYDNYIAVVRECKNRKENIDEMVLFMNLIVKYFTNVFVDESGKELYTNKSQNLYKRTMVELKIMESLIDLDLYGQIIEEINPGEINELDIWIKKMGKNLLEINKYVEELEEKDEQS